MVMIKKTDNCYISKHKMTWFIKYKKTEGINRTRLKRIMVTDSRKKNGQIAIQNSSESNKYI